MRHHGVFALALLGGALIRLVTMLGYPGVLWFTGDSYFYLGGALRPWPSPSKTLGYSFMLWLLEPFHSLTLVAFLQHLMGLAVAVMVYALLRRAGLPGWAATLVTLPVLYDAYQIQLEHLLMAESIFTFLIAAAVTLVLWRRRPLWWVALFAGLLLGYAVLVRTAGAAMIPVAVGCLVVRRAGWRACAAALVGGVVPLAAYALWFHSAHGTYGLTLSDGIYLWGRTSTFADCDRIRPPAQERKLCLHDRPEDRIAPGTLIWRKEVPPRRLRGGPVDPGNNDLLRGFALRAIVAQPLDYAGAVARGVGMAVSPHRIGHPNPGTESLYHFRDRPQLFPAGKSWAGGGTALSDARAYGGDTPSRVVEPNAGRMRWYQEHLFLPGPALGVLLVAGAAGIVVARGRRTEALTAWSAAVTLLVFPIATADFDYRYVLPTLPFACLAAGLALTPAREFGPRVSRWWGSRGSRRRDSDPATEP
ncbi:phospholipid carrier-dependent glycosyltransferase [Actinomadura sp. HBU206391]|uniref:phospholipid carrier-dependent glycosyltransferase n=1 Tax=Actinomadura sp. HBU206391 TaxID=2731692 RepID=UPI00164F73DD|nr:phospholipid carrier-dependent glycosyltransferase [Actinomadura sp. HBU206391]MBC6460018.1 phospholipid carrier-dependent glycosyltransferase [Actinomadura sp. HBU206391]